MNLLFQSQSAVIVRWYLDLRAVMTILHGWMHPYLYFTVLCLKADNIVLRNKINT